MFRSKLQTDFTTTHEREHYDELEKMLRNEYSDKDENLLLIGNYTLHKGTTKCEIDAIVIKSDAVIIIDFKDNKGKLKFHEKEKWTMEGEEVKAGSFLNPLFQIRYYKSKLSYYLAENASVLSDEGKKSNFAHTSGIVLFSRDIDFDKNVIEGRLRSWFCITDMNNILSRIKNITSREIKLNNDDVDKILELLKIDIPAEPNVRVEPAEIIPVTLTPVHKEKTLKPTKEGKILDYYYTCLEQEQLKQLNLKVFRNADDSLDRRNNFRILPSESKELFEDDESSLKIDINTDLGSFFETELNKSNPRTLFYGYSLITKKDAKYEHIYPVFYCQIKYDKVLKTLEKSDLDECLFNRLFLNNLGYTDREEIEAVSNEIDSLGTFFEKFSYIKRLAENNKINNDLNDQTILFFSETSSYILNLLQELGENGLGGKLLETLQGNVANNLVTEPNIQKNSTVDDIPFLEVFKLNKSQEEAVISALNNNFTVVTGPPGTGKSQVVLNILANMFMLNKPVLFASKNNKAVEVVQERMVKDILHPENLDESVVRIGKKDILKNTLIHFDTLSGKINAGTISFDKQLYDNLYEKQKSINSGIIAAHILINQSEQHLKTINSLKAVNESVHSAFFNNESFTADAELLKFTQSELYDLVKKNNLGLIKKLTLFILPSYYRNKYFRSLMDFKSKLPSIILDYYNKEKALSGKFTLDEILLRIDFLLYIKETEKTVTSVKEFILKNIIVEPSVKLDLYSAEKYINDFILLKENDIEILHNNKEDNSRKLLVEKVKKNLTSVNSINKISSYKDYTWEFNFGGSIAGMDFKKEWYKSFKNILSVLPVWSVTSLGIRNGLPLFPDMFDLIIVDEASQCDIPSAVPLFYRGKNVCIIGDDLQLKHIPGISEGEDTAVSKMCGIPEASGRYTKSSLYDKCAELSIRAENKIIFLDEHYRSHENIMDFCNKHYYLPERGAEMRNKTPETRLNFEPKGVFWVNVKGDKSVRHKYNNNELNKCIELYKYFTKDGINSDISFGIASPFRNQANNIKHRLIDEGINVDSIEKVTGNTIHVFQGDERDVMFLSLVVSEYATDGMVNFINYYATQLINVGVSRARSAVFIVGDKDYCISKGGILKDLAIYATDFKLN